MMPNINPRIFLLVLTILVPGLCAAKPKEICGQPVSNFRLSHNEYVEDIKAHSNKHQQFTEVVKRFLKCYSSKASLSHAARSSLNGFSGTHELPVTDVKIIKPLNDKPLLRGRIDLSKAKTLRDSALRVQINALGQLSDLLGISGDKFDVEFIPQSNGMMIAVVLIDQCHSMLQDSNRVGAEAILSKVTAELSLEGAEIALGISGEGAIKPTKYDPWIFLEPSIALEKSPSEVEVTFGGSLSCSSHDGFNVCGKSICKKEWNPLGNQLISASSGALFLERSINSPGVSGAAYSMDNVEVKGAIQGSMGIGFDWLSGNVGAKLKIDEIEAFSKFDILPEINIKNVKVSIAPMNFEVGSVDIAQGIELAGEIEYMGLEGDISAKFEPDVSVGAHQLIKFISHGPPLQLDGNMTVSVSLEALESKVLQPLPSIIRKAVKSTFSLGDLTVLYSSKNDKRTIASKANIRLFGSSHSVSFKTPPTRVADVKRALINEVKELAQNPYRYLVLAEAALSGASKAALNAAGSVGEVVGGAVLDSLNTIGNFANDIGSAVEDTFNPKTTVYANAIAHNTTGQDVFVRFTGAYMSTVRSGINLPMHNVKHSYELYGHEYYILFPTPFIVNALPSSKSSLTGFLMPYRGVFYGSARDRVTRGHHQHYFAEFFVKGLDGSFDKIARYEWLAFLNTEGARKCEIIKRNDKYGRINAKFSRPKRNECRAVFTVKKGRPRSWVTGKPIWPDFN